MIVTGSPDIGGTRVSLAQMAAEELGIDVYSNPSRRGRHRSGRIHRRDGRQPGHILHRDGSDPSLPQDRHGSQGQGGQNVGCRIDEVEWVDGQAQGTSGSEPPLSLGQIASAAGKTGGPITASASLNPRGVGVASRHSCATSKWIRTQVP